MMTAWGVDHMQRTHLAFLTRAEVVDTDALSGAAGVVARAVP